MSANSTESVFSLSADQVEKLLITGEQPELLKSYFGDVAYQELRELARQASTRAKRGGPRVLILPGILGSTLAVKKSIRYDTIWFDPFSIIAGDLDKLALGASRINIEPRGPLPMFYTKLKFRLWWYGFDADYFSFDWRQSLETLGQQLADRIEQEPAGEIHLVAHSMGGLVSRAALTALGAKGSKVKRLVMLGTPNGGSFVPVQVFQGVSQLVRQVAMLDLSHNAQSLADKVFRTFPAIHQMLPNREKWNGIDLYDAANWPDSSPKPDAAMLKETLRVQSQLAPPDSRFSLIAGVSQPTITDLKLVDGKFSYTETHNGDTTVPTDFAVLPNMLIRYVKDTHTGMCGNAEVAEAVSELLRTGKTEKLLKDRPTTRALRERGLSEDQLRGEVSFGGRRGNALTEQEKRSILENMLGPMQAVGAASGPSSPTGPARPGDDTTPPGGSLLQGVVVGRRKQHRLDIELYHGSLSDVDTRAYVLGLYQNVTPAGPAAMFDRLMDGVIGELVSRRMFSAGVGEVFVLPTGTHKVSADFLVFAGLGHFDQFTPDVQQLVATNILRTMIHARIDEFATILFGSGSGQESAESLDNLVHGFFEGLLNADKRHRFRRVVLCEMDGEKYRQMRNRLYHLASTPLFDEVEVTITEQPPAPADAPPIRSATHLPNAEEEPVYLIVRHNAEAEQAHNFSATALTAGGKATVVTSVRNYDPKKLDELLETIPSPKFNLDTFGDAVTDMVLTEEFVDMLAKSLDHDGRSRPLIVVHDAPSSRVPWETLRLGKSFPALAGGLSRRYMAGNLSIAKWLEERRIDATLDVLLVVNPTEDLDGAEKEGDLVRRALSEVAGAKVTELRGAKATWGTLREAFQSGKYDVIHYAGHAQFVADNPSQSGIFCADRRVLSGKDLASFGSLPAIVFFNACESGRLRKKPSVRERMDQGLGLAEAFLRGGIAHFVGTYWPVGDAAALEFGKEFYRQILAGHTMGEAMQQGRKKVLEVKSNDWADYIHYGDREFRLKEKLGES